MVHVPPREQVSPVRGSQSKGQRQWRKISSLVVVLYSHSSRILYSVVRCPDPRESKVREFFARGLIDLAQQLTAGASGVFEHGPAFLGLTVVMGMREHRYENKERLSPLHRYGLHALTIAVIIGIAAEVFPKLHEVPL